MPIKRIHFTLATAEYEQLRSLAGERGCTVSELAREAVRAAYLEPFRLQARLGALNDLLAPFGVLAEDEEAANRLREDLETMPRPAAPPFPTDLNAFLAGLDVGSLFAEPGPAADALDDLRARVEPAPARADESDAP